MNATVTRLPRAAVFSLAVLTLAACGRDQAAAPAAAPDLPAPADAAAPVADAPAARVARLLAEGNAAFKDSRFVAPAGDNAFERFLAASAIDSAHPGAQEAIVEVFPIAVAAAERALQADDLDEAARIQVLLQRAAPDSLALRALQERLDARRATLASPAAPTAALPAADSPAARPTPTNPTSASPNATPTPEPLLAAVPPASAPPASPVRREARRDEPGVAAAPASAATAASPPPATGDPQPANTPLVPPRVVLRIEPAYPQLARQRRIEGWVELDFVVGVDGQASDIRVVESSPNAVFDTAATRALQRWRFEPARRGAQAESSRSRTRITFRLG